jgi:hypothetical protein
MPRVGNVREEKPLFLAILPYDELRNHCLWDSYFNKWHISYSVSNAHADDDPISKMFQTKYILVLLSLDILYVWQLRDLAATELHEKLFTFIKLHSYEQWQMFSSLGRRYWLMLTPKFYYLTASEAHRRTDRQAHRQASSSTCFPPPRMKGDRETRVAGAQGTRPHYMFRYINYDQRNAVETLFKSL